MQQAKLSKFYPMITTPLVLAIELVVSLIQRTLERAIELDSVRVLSSIENCINYC